MITFRKIRRIYLETFHVDSVLSLGFLDPIAVLQGSCDINALFILRKKTKLEMTDTHLV